MAENKQHINRKLEFSWRFWLPFVFLAIAVVLAEDRHPMLAFISGLAIVLAAEDSREIYCAEAGGAGTSTMNHICRVFVHTSTESRLSSCLATAPPLTANHSCSPRGT